MGADVHCGNCIDFLSAKKCERCDDYSMWEPGEDEATNGRELCPTCRYKNYEGPEWECNCISICNENYSEWAPAKECELCRWAFSDKCNDCNYNNKWSPHVVTHKDHECGIKYDNGKLDLSLIPGEALELLGQVYQVGSSKYGRDNWSQGFDENRLLAAGLRHYVAYRKGQETDSESGLSHLACAAWNMLTVAILKERNAK